MQARRGISYLGALQRQTRWAYCVGWPYGTQVKPGWIMYFGAPFRWTQAEMDSIKARAAILAAELKELAE